MIKNHYLFDVFLAPSDTAGSSRHQQSGVIRLDVSGRPQVLTYETQAVQPFATEDDAVLKVVFCADPRPRSVTWEWANVRLSEGKI